MKHSPNDDNHKKNVEPFEQWAATYETSLLHETLISPVQDSVLAYMLERCAAPAHVLDIGCGTGRLLLNLAKRVPTARLAGIDPSPEMLDIARSKAASTDRVTFMQAFAEELPFEDGSFDTVVSTLSFHHWEDQAKALNEVKRVLTDDGLFFFSDTTFENSQHTLDLHHRGEFFSPERVTGLFAAAGFIVDGTVTLNHKGNSVDILCFRLDL